MYKEPDAYPTVVFFFKMNSMSVMPMLQPSLEHSTVIKMLVAICTKTSAFPSSIGLTVGM